MLHRRELHLCEHYSTFWVNFCQLEFLMRRICALNFCTCGSEGEEERRASLSIMIRLVISVRLGFMLGM